MKSAPWKASARLVVAEMVKGSLCSSMKARAGLLDDRQRVGVDIVQHDVAAFQHLALQDIADGAVAKLGAACADQDDAFFHVMLLADLK